MRLLNCILVLTTFTFCACSEQGPTRYQISGEVKFNGQPVAYGDVLFTPDGAKGNSGPQGVAYINNGSYDTRNTDGKGIAGGPTVIHIRGLNKQGGNKTLLRSIDSRMNRTLPSPKAMLHPPV